MGQVLVWGLVFALLVTVSDNMPTTTSTRDEIILQIRRSSQSDYLVDGMDRES